MYSKTEDAGLRCSGTSARNCTRCWEHTRHVKLDTVLGLMVLTAKVIYSSKDWKPPDF